MDVVTQDGGVDIGADGVDVVDHEAGQLRSNLKQVLKGPVSQQVGDLIPMPHRV